MEMQTNFTAEPLDATLGVRVTDLEVAALDDEGFARLYALWLDHALLVLPQQHLSREQQIAFAGRFGSAESGIFDLSTVRPDGVLRSDEMEEDASFLNMLRQLRLACRRQLWTGAANGRGLQRASRAHLGR